MSDIPFPSLPHKLEPGPVTFGELKAQFYPDCKRIRVMVVTSGEGHRPSLDFVLQDAAGKELARSVIVENYDQRTEFTMHILKPEFECPLTLTCRAYFENSDFSAEQSVLVSEG